MKPRFAPVWTVVACITVASCGGGGDASGGGDDNNPPPPPPPATVQYVAPADSTFVAAIDPNNPGAPALGQLGNYAGARLFITGTIQSGSPTIVNQAGYTEVYKGSDGHIYRVDLAITGSPAATQVSSESNATIDDLCSLNGATVSLGTDVNYLAEQYFNDYANPENSAYFYRLPGADGSCNTSDDVVYMVKLGMSSTDTPVLARMPAAVAHDPNTGAISGFVVNEGTALTFYDSNFQNRVVLETPTTPIGVAYPLGTTYVTATGRLFVLDGNIVYVNYGTQSVSPTLFTIPNWSASKRFPTAANPTTLYFSADTSDYTLTPVALTSALYSIPRDGSATATQLSTESGIIQAIASPVGGTTTVYSVVPPKGFYTVRTLTNGSSSGAVTAVTATGNAGSFIASDASIYYTFETISAPDSMTRIYANTSTGIVAMDGTVIESPLANSKFIAQQSDANGSDWLNVVLATNLAPVTLVSTANGITYTEDGISGATLEVVSTATNSVTATLGTLPAGTVMSGTGTLTGPAGYLDGLNVNSTLDPTSRDLFYINTGTANSLEALTSNLH